MDDLEEHVQELEDRVSYLERELELSYMREKFERDIDRLVSDSATVETKDGVYGHHARIGEINGDDVQYIIDRVERRDGYDYAVTETGTGLGMEVWTEKFK